MKPKTIIIDFDSTMVAHESLEWLIAQTVTDAKVLKSIDEITKRGMNGDLDFPTSLNQRLALASPRKSDLQGFANASPGWYATGLTRFLNYCAQARIEIQIVSGGLQDLIILVTNHLGMTEDRVHAIEVEWVDDQLKRVLPTPALRSKCEALKQLKGLDSPMWAIGDGFSDFQLFQAGYVDRFLAYCEFVERPFVQSHNLEVVRSFDEIISLLEKT